MNIANPAAPVNIAFVLPGLEPGGAEKNVLTLASRLDRRRFRPCIVSVTGDNSLEGDFRRAGIPVHILPFPSIRSAPGGMLRFLRPLSFLLRLRDLLKAEKIRIVHSYLPLANIAGTAAGVLARTPVRIVSKRALCRYKAGHAVNALFEDLANLASHKVIVNSRAVEEDVRRTEHFLGNRIAVVYNGIDVPGSVPRHGGVPPPAALPIPPGADPVVYVANIREDKAHLCLVDAAREVVSAFPSAIFLFVGAEKSEAAAVRRRIRELKLEERIVVTGPRRDVSAIREASRIAAHPGEQEGFSNAILEAMADGLPVVASRAGGNPEAVVEGETGHLVPPGDAAALAKAILALLRDPGQARALGAAGRRRALERFSVDRMVAEVEDIYDDLLRRKSAR